MNDKELIELIKFTAFQMLMPQKISDEDAESILKDYKEAICPHCEGTDIQKNFYTDTYGCNSCGHSWAK